MQGGLCTECGREMGTQEWSFTYGQHSRGANPRTGEVDRRILGTHKVFACGSCERQAIKAVFGTFAGQMAVSFGPVGLVLLLAILGLASVDYAQEQLRIAGLALVGMTGAAVFKWSRGRGQYMREGFFRLHRSELADRHSVGIRSLTALDGLKRQREMTS